MERAQTEQGPPHRPDPRRLQLEADDEQEENDTQFGSRRDRADIDHRTDRVRPQDDAHDEQAQHRAEARPLEKDDGGGTRPEEQDRGGQDLVEMHGAVAPVLAGQATLSGLYLIRCGWSASVPSRL